MVLVASRPPVEQPSIADETITATVAKSLTVIPVHDKPRTLGLVR